MQVLEFIAGGVMGLLVIVGCYFVADAITNPRGGLLHRGDKPRDRS